MKPGAFDVLTEDVRVGPLSLSIRRPRDSEALLDEEAFEREEFLPYWAELWPSALALAEAVAERELDGSRVLELGCGLAVPSLVAALRGADALATDWSADALAFAEENAHLNGARLDTLRVDWAEPELLLERGPWDLVLASDVLYERRNVAQLLDLLQRVLEGGGEALVADPGRPHAKAFFEGAAERWSLEVVRERVVALRPAPRSA